MENCFASWIFLLLVFFLLLFQTLHILYPRQKHKWWKFTILKLSILLSIKWGVSSKKCFLHKTFLGIIIKISTKTCSLILTQNKVKKIKNVELWITKFYYISIIKIKCWSKNDYYIMWLLTKSCNENCDGAQL